MQDTIDAQIDDVDLAVAAYRRAGQWVVDELTREHCEDVETLAEALRHLGGDIGALALVSIDEDFFVIVRVQGPRTQVLLSDASAAEDWDLAESVLEVESLKLNLMTETMKDKELDTALNKLTGDFSSMITQ